MCLCTLCMLIYSHQQARVWKGLARETSAVWGISTAALHFLHSILHPNQCCPSRHSDPDQFKSKLCKAGSPCSYKEQLLCHEGSNAWFTHRGEGWESLQGVGQEMLLPWKSREASSWQGAIKPLLTCSTEDRFHTPWLQHAAQEHSLQRLHRFPKLSGLGMLCLKRRSRQFQPQFEHTASKICSM